MVKNIHIDNIERSFAKTGNEKFVLIYGKEKAQFWGTEQGEDSTAKKQFVNLGIKPGSECEIEFIEEPESFTNAKGEVINWTKRSIRGIFPVNASPTPTPQGKPYAPFTPKEPQVQQSFTESREQFGRRLAIHGMVNGMLASGKHPVDIDLPTLIVLEDRINRALQGDDLNVDDLPF